MSCLRRGSLFGIFGITNPEFAAAENSRNSIGSEISNHVAGIVWNAESLRRLGDLHEAAPATPVGPDSPRLHDTPPVGEDPPDARGHVRHSAPEGRAGQLEDPCLRPRAELYFFQVSSCSAATVRHGGPGRSAHPVRRNAMTHFNTSLAQPAKRNLNLKEVEAGLASPLCFGLSVSQNCHSTDDE